MHSAYMLLAHRWTSAALPERFERAVQRGAAFGRVVSNLAVVVRRMGLMTAR
jgi:hypothetical protein